MNPVTVTPVGVTGAASPVTTGVGVTVTPADTVTATRAVTGGPVTTDVSPADGRHPSPVTNGAVTPVTRHHRGAPVAVTNLPATPSPVTEVDYLTGTVTPTVIDAEPVTPKTRTTTVLTGVTAAAAAAVITADVTTGHSPLWWALLAALTVAAGATITTATNEKTR